MPFRRDGKSRQPHIRALPAQQGDGFPRFPVGGPDDAGLAGPVIEMRLRLAKRAIPMPLEMNQVGKLEADLIRVGDDFVPYGLGAFPNALSVDEFHKGWGSVLGCTQAIAAS